MNISLLSAFVFSGLIGLSLGLIGGGGSIITLPVLVYLAGIDPPSAVGMSLAIVGATRLVGAGFHYLRGTVDLKKGVLFGGFGASGAYFGSGLTRLVSGETLLLIFALLLAAVALVMMFRKGPPRMEGSGGPTDLKKTAAAGMAVGVLTGFLGVRGGFLFVPALVLLGGVEIGAAIGTSLLVIATNSRRSVRTAPAPSARSEDDGDLRRHRLHRDLDRGPPRRGGVSGEAAEGVCMVRHGGRPFFDLQKSGGNHQITNWRKTDVDGAAFCRGDRTLFLPFRLR